MVKHDEKSVIFNEKQVELGYRIRKVIEFKNVIVVLFYDKKVLPNNVIAFDPNGNQLWMINDILNIKMPTGNVDIKKMTDEMLGVYSDLSIEYAIDINKNDLVNKTYLR